MRDIDQEWRPVSFRRTLVIFGSVALLLTLLSGVLWLGVHFSTPETFDRWHFFFWYFDVGREYNVPTWYSSLLWGLAGLLPLYLGALGQRTRWSWGFFGGRLLPVLH